MSTAPVPVAHVDGPQQWLWVSGTVIPSERTTCSVWAM
jgi:hypothetical protein